MKIYCNLILARWDLVIYFKLSFSFSCSCFVLTLIKKSHALSFYLFLQKFLLKTKTYKLVVSNWWLVLLLKQKIQKKLSTFATSVLLTKLTSHMLSIHKNSLINSPVSLFVIVLLRKYFFQNLLKHLYQHITYFGILFLGGIPL